MPTITVPYQWEPNRFQIEVLNCSARFRVIFWHRRARKTSLAVNELIRRSFAKRGVYVYLAPYREQAKRIVWDSPDMLAKYCPPLVWEARNNSELKLVFPNGSVLYVMGSDNADALRGMDIRGICFDEYQDHRPEVWSIVSPILTGNNGWAWFLGTPKGVSDLISKLDYAKSSGNKEWAAFELKASESGIISLAALEEAKRTMPQAMFEQEFELKIIDGATAFFRRILDNCIDPPRAQRDHQYQLGVDLAKYQDWTVITPFDLNTFEALEQDRFNQVDWSLQKARVEAAFYRFNRALTRVDGTGVGDPIVEDLTKSLTNVEGYKFTAQSREDLLKNLACQLEQDRIKIPRDDGLIAELRSFRYDLTDRGTVRIACPEGQHDDRVMSLALAVWGIPSSPLPLREDRRRPPPVRSYVGRNFREREEVY